MQSWCTVHKSPTASGKPPRGGGTNENAKIRIEATHVLSYIIPSRGRRGDAAGPKWVPQGDALRCGKGELACPTGTHSNLRTNTLRSNAVFARRSIDDIHQGALKPTYTFTAWRTGLARPLGLSRQVSFDTRQVTKFSPISTFFFLAYTVNFTVASPTRKIFLTWWHFFLAARIFLLLQEKNLVPRKKYSCGKTSKMLGNYT